jgi:hypothetical protein
LRAHDGLIQPLGRFGKTVQAKDVFTGIGAETNLLESLDFFPVLGQTREKALDPHLSSPGAQMAQQTMPYRWGFIGG